MMTSHNQQTPNIELSVIDLELRPHDVLSLAAKLSEIEASLSLNPSEPELLTHGNDVSDVFPDALAAALRAINDPMNKIPYVSHAAFPVTNCAVLIRTPTHRNSYWPESPNYSAAKSMWHPDIAKERLF